MRRAYSPDRKRVALERRDYSPNPGRSRASYRPRSPPRDRDNRKTRIHCRLLIDDLQVGVIIGRCGETVKRIRTECNVSIAVLSPPKAAAHHPGRVTTIQGRPESIADACERIYGLFVARDESNHTKNAAVVLIKILIPEKLMSIIADKRPDLAQDLQMEDRMPGCDEVLISINGSLRSTICYLYTFLFSLPNDVTDFAQWRLFDPFSPPLAEYPPPIDPCLAFPPFAPFNPSSSSSPNFIQHAPPLLPPPPPPHEILAVQDVAIAACHVGHAIGYRGSTLEHIQRQAGCRVEFVADASVPPHERVFRISGPLQCIDFTTKLLSDAIHNGVTAK